MIAYKNFKQIQQLPDVVEKHRNWLKDYEGKKFSKGIDGVDLIKWKHTKYSNKDFDTGINKVGGLGNRLVIEFDGDEKEAKEFLELTEKRLRENKWGFIRSSHKGKSDYLWIEFTEDLSPEEKKKFLKWIAPPKSEIDLNFSSPNFCFPVLYAIHWKHSNFRETPIDYFEGEQIDYSKLDIKIPLGKIKACNKNGFKYTTFKAGKIFSNKGQGEDFDKNQPIFYDKNGNFWLWNNEKFFWEITDEVDLLNIIEEEMGEDIISSKRRTEIINTLKQRGRKRTPKEIKKTWIQFQDEIIDISNSERFKANPDYFVTNPIPYKITNSIDTPVMDKIFKEWVGKEYVPTLYEILAYCLIPDYPIHRLFCFIGEGMNGKSCYLNLLKKFLGKNNVTCTELDVLLNSRFEITKLHKKLACIMGETNFNQLSKTSILKRLTGGDMIGFEYKNKTPFDELNYAKILIATNNLPETDDKTLGFYRRWCIIDFPNRFTEQKDILEDIPEEEYNNLTTKCIFILNELLKTRKFTNEGSIEERTKKFEDKSNPLLKFISENTENDFEEFISSNEFNKKLNEWCKSNRFRSIDERTVGKNLKSLGYEKGRKHVDWLFDGKGGQIYVYLGIKWKS